jgi:hypothetical protein
MPTGELVFPVHKLLPHHDQTIDPFTMYPHFPTKMYSSSSSSHLENVKVSWVVSHFAQWAVLSDTVVILSLSCVSTIHLEKSPVSDYCQIGLIFNFTLLHRFTYIYNI